MQSRPQEPLQADGNWITVLHLRLQKDNMTVSFEVECNSKYQKTQSRQICYHSGKIPPGDFTI